MDSIFEVIMFLVVVGSYVFRFIKGRAEKKRKGTLASLAASLDGMVESNGEVISGAIEDVPFEIRYMPTDDESVEGVGLQFVAELPFAMDIAARAEPLNGRSSQQSEEFLTGDSAFDKQYSVTTDNEKACRQYLLDPLFRAGVQLVMKQGYTLRFRHEYAVLHIPGSAWLSDSEQALNTLKQMLQVGHSLIAELQDN